MLLRLDRLAAEAIGAVVVDDAARLHPGVDDDRADELEAALLQCSRDLFRERSLCGNGAAVLNRLVACHLPYPRREVLACVRHGHIDACAVDGRFDLGAGADDAFILQEPRYVGFAHARYLPGIEVAKGFAEGLAFAQNGEPGEAGLEAVKHERLPERPAVAFGHAPLFVVVGAHQRIIFGP